MARVRLDNRRPAKTTAGKHFYVEPIMRDGKRLVAGQRREAISEASAIGIAAELAERMVGVVAVAVELDDDGNAIGEPRVIVSHGEVPGLPIGGDA